MQQNPYRVQREVWKKIACNVENDLNAFYRYARKRMKTKDSVCPLINDNGDVMHDSPCVASMLSKYFASVFFLL